MRISLDTNQQRYQKLCCTDSSGQQLNLNNGCFEILDSGSTEAQVCFGDIFQDVSEFSLNEYSLQPGEKRIVGSCASNEIGMNSGMVIRVDYSGDAVTQDKRYILYREYDSKNVINYSNDVDISLQGNVSFNNTQYSEVTVEGTMTLSFVGQPTSDINLVDLTTGNLATIDIPFEFCLSRDSSGQLTQITPVSELSEALQSTNYGLVNLCYTLQTLDSSALIYSGNQWIGNIDFGLELNYNGLKIFGGGVDASLSATISTSNYGISVDSDDISFAISQTETMDNVSVFSPIGQIAVFSANIEIFHYPLQVLNPQSETVKIKVLQF